VSATLSFHAGRDQQFPDCAAKMSLARNRFCGDRERVHGAGMGFKL